MPENTFITLFVAFIGAAMTAAGILKRGRGEALRSVPCLPAASLAAGARQFVTGRAQCQTTLAAPVTGKPCVFFLERTYRKETRYTSKGGRRTHWALLGSRASGAFFVRDREGGCAVVLPHAGSAALCKPEEQESGGVFSDLCEDGATRRSEQIINEDETVTVLGAPQPLEDFMNYLAAHSALEVPPYFLADLKKRQADGVATPCFFGGGVEKVADQGCEAYVAGIESSGELLMQLGGGIALLGILLYILGK
ncbi:MAG TPA: hypothetical protein PKI19_01740 [Elusimicrobiales bacterium]|nr:hypothetical protein [Elusimicrobiales bacterium]